MNNLKVFNEIEVESTNVTGAFNLYFKSLDGPADVPST